MSESRLPALAIWAAETAAVLISPAPRSASYNCCTGSRRRSRRTTGITIARSFVGEYCTSLEMAGASITLVKLDDAIEEPLAAPASVVNRIF